MGQQDFGIGLRVNIDTGAIKRLPQEVQQALGRLSQVFGDSGGYGEKRFGAALAGLGKGTAKDISDQKRNLAASRNALREYYAQQEQDLRKHLREMMQLRSQEEKAAVDKSPWNEKDINAAYNKQRMADRSRYQRQREDLRDEQRRAMADMRMAGAGWPGADGEPPGAPGGGGGRRGGMSHLLFGTGGLQRGGGVVGGLMRSVGIPLGIGGLTYFGIRQMRQALHNDTERFNLAKRVGSVSDIYGPSGDFADKLSIPLVGPSESIRLHSQFAGLAGPGRGDQARNAALLGMGFGVGSGAGVDFFGGMSRMGVTQSRMALQLDGGKPKLVDEQKRFALEIGEAIVHAQMRGREGEMFQTLTEYAQMGLRTMLNGPNGSDLLSLVTRAAATGEPGMKGELGARVLGAAHSAITGADPFAGIGGGMVKPFLMSAMMNAGITDPTQMSAIAQKGLFGKIGNQQTWEVVMDQLRQSGMPEFMQANAMGLPIEHFRGMTSMRAAEAGGRRVPDDLREKIMGVPQRIGAAGAALHDATSEEDLRARLEKIIKETPGNEEREKMLADTAEALDKAFRELIPTINAVTAAFNKYLGGGGAVSTGEAALGVGGVAWGALKLRGLLGGAGAAAAGAASTAAGPAGEIAGHWLPRLLGKSLGVVGGPVGVGISAAGYVLSPTDAGVGSELPDLTPEQRKILNTPGSGARPSSAKGPLARVPLEVREAIFTAAQKHGVDPAYLASIWLAEGGKKAKLGGASAPFGISDAQAKKWHRATDLDSKADLAATTIANRARDYGTRTGHSAVDASGQRYTEDFTKFLGSSYAPLNDRRDVNGLNRNWPRNVARSYNDGMDINVNVTVRDTRGELLPSSASIVPHASTNSLVAP